SPTWRSVWAGMTRRLSATTSGPCLAARPANTPTRTAVSAGMATLPRVDPTDLAFAGASEQARLLAAGTVTAPALLDIYLERIARLDPELRSYRVVLADS